MRLGKYQTHTAKVFLWRLTFQQQALCNKGKQHAAAYNKRTILQIAMKRRLELISRLVSTIKVQQRTMPAIKFGSIKTTQTQNYSTPDLP